MTLLLHSYGLIVGLWQLLHPNDRFGKAIKAHLFAPVPVAAAFIVGALVILWVERRQQRNPAVVRIDSVDAMRWPDALKVGLARATATPLRRVSDQRSFPDRSVPSLHH